MKSLRIWRSYNSDFGKLLKSPDDLKDETVTASTAYTDDVLSEIAGNGFNAIWVHGLLQNIVPSEVFPEFGKNSSVHIENMSMLIDRASKYGIKVILYMQPPRGIDEKNPFWQKHADAGGVRCRFTTDDGYKVIMRALCTSTEKVKSYLRLSSERLAKELPGLGGVILITAGEYPSHCYGRFGFGDNLLRKGSKNAIGCRRCIKRHPTDVVTEIIRLVHSGIRGVSSKQDIIAWNWSWTLYEKSPCPTIIKNLPEDVILLTGFERGDTKIILGKERLIDEYSLAFIGPSKRFTRTYNIAKKQNIKIMAKLQIGTTHELATVPNLPLIGNLYEKARQLRKKGIYDFMGCWNFGNMFSANTVAFNTFMSCKKLTDKKSALKSFAENYFPGCQADIITEAWDKFAGAMENYPFSVPFLYNSPLNYSLAYQLKPGPLSNCPAGRSWQMDQRGDNLESSLKQFCLSEVLKGLREVMRQWKEAARLLSRGLAPSNCLNAKKEESNAWLCYHIFRSAWNTYRVYRLRDKWSSKKITQYCRIVKDESANLNAVLPIVEGDWRFGFHSEAHAYMFDRISIKKKIDALKKQMRKYP